MKRYFYPLCLYFARSTSTKNTFADSTLTRRVVSFAILTSRKHLKGRSVRVMIIVRLLKWSYVIWVGCRGNWRCTSPLMKFESKNWKWIGMEWYHFLLRWFKADFFSTFEQSSRFLRSIYKTCSGFPKMENFQCYVFVSLLVNIVHFIEIKTSSTISKWFCKLGVHLISKKTHIKKRARFEEISNIYKLFWLSSTKIEKM